MEAPARQAALLVFLFAAVMVLGLLAKAGLRRAGVPPLVGYLVLGVALRIADDRLGVLGTAGGEVLEFLATLGVIALLFRVGLESDLPGLIRQLRSAAPVWLGNVVVSAAAGYLTARYVLSFEVIPSVVIATALTATSVGIPAHVWQQAGALDSANGQRFLDVAEMDDLSGVVFMALLFSVLPVLRAGGGGDLLSIAAAQAGLFALKLAAFAGLCVLFSRYVEQRFTRFVRRIESGPDPMLVVVGTGMLVAALAGLLGFSVAIGAFFAGLLFSQDPQRVKVDASFAPLYDLFTPFFFVGVGLAMDPGLAAAAAGAGAVLLVAAVGGKLLGTAGPALLYTGWPHAAALGVSMVPRAEIAMLIMHRAVSLGSEVVPPSAYGGMVLVSAATCLAAPPLLARLLGGRQGRGRPAGRP
jgi:Kef-type K+ transport system membrane component KefB